jgi:replicative DNA helicase
VPFEAIESGKLSTEQFRAVYRAMDDIRELPLSDHRSADGAVGQLNRMIKRQKRKFAAKGKTLKLAIVDYLQLIRPDGKCDNRTQEITQVSMGLKAAAKSNDVGLMALAQLSRAVEQRQDHRPQLSDLRESGQIEQDADLILFLYRQEYYLQQIEPRYNDEARAKWETALEACRNQIEYICAKRRQGRTGTKRGSFYGNVQAVR